MKVVSQLLLIALLNALLYLVTVDQSAKVSSFQNTIQRSVSHIQKQDSTIKEQNFIISELQISITKILSEKDSIDSISNTTFSDSSKLVHDDILYKRVRSSSGRHRRK